MTGSSRRTAASPGSSPATPTRWSPRDSAWCRSIRRTCSRSSRRPRTWRDS